MARSRINDKLTSGRQGDLSGGSLGLFPRGNFEAVQGEFGDEKQRQDGGDSN
jgi:hypothetical protein